MAFALPPRETFRRQDFFPSPANAEALAALGDWPNWPAGKMLLVGPTGSGKTHLAHLWAEETGAQVLFAADLARTDLPDLIRPLQTNPTQTIPALADPSGPLGLTAPSGAPLTAIVVEDAQTIAGNRAAETALFHLHNLLAAEGRLLVTADAPPRDWGLDLPDLLSRMQAAPLTRLNSPDDALLAAVLIKLFADRQIVVQANLISYLVDRIERSIAAARQVVAMLDSHALALGRPVSRALATQLLDRLDQG